MFSKDGIGPESMQHVKEAFRYVRAPVDFEDVLLNSNNKTEDILQQAYISVVCLIVLNFFSFNKHENL